ncbi:hypothetical protein ABGA94_21375, partial [Stenotrophomonas sp. 3diitr2024]
MTVVSVEHALAGKIPEGGEVTVRGWVRTPDGNTGTFEVWGKRKGDMARAVMYMAIRYEGGKDA